MIISGMVKSSLVDYPGLIAGVLFVPGCNYDCFYCHNRSLIDGTHEILDLRYVNEFLIKRIGLLDGIVITGGEPTLQCDLLLFMDRIKKLGFKLKLDTNGSNPQVIRDLIRTGLCDYYAVDYKAPTARYGEICGCAANPENVIKSIELLLEAGSDFEVRTTVIPQLGKSDLVCMSKELPIVPRYVLNRYRKPERYLPCDKARIETKPYSQKEIEYFSDTICFNQPNVLA